MHFRQHMMLMVIVYVTWVEFALGQPRTKPTDWDDEQDGVWEAPEPDELENPHLKLMEQQEKMLERRQRAVLCQEGPQARATVEDVLISRLTGDSFDVTSQAFKRWWRNTHHCGCPTICVQEIHVIHISRALLAAGA
jgi:hypothetical protein